MAVDTHDERPDRPVVDDRTGERDLMIGSIVLGVAACVAPVVTIILSLT
jgi:hypothetical protein